MEKVSAVLLTRNEERNVERCLRSLAWVDEVVVVDTGSRDQTLALATKYTQSIFRGDINRGFSYNRNLGNRKARNAWILKIDADEVVSPAFSEEVLERMRSHRDVDGYVAASRIHFRGKWIRGCGWYPMYQVRLFDKRKANWEGMIHERLVLQGRTSLLKNDILHYSYVDIQQYFQKFNLYTSFEARRMKEQGRRISGWNMPERFLLRPAGYFMKSYFLQKGFRDGFYGFLVSLYSSFYVLVKYMKLYELQQDSSTNLPAEVEK